MANGRSKATSDRNLLQAACHEFQKVDTYHRGLITSANFAKALGTLGLKYGQPEVDEILEYCTVTDDGYVHYKELHNSLSPDQPRAKQSSMKTTIYPSEASEMMASSGERNGFYVAKTEDIRKVFALWERGRISSEQFKEALQRCGAPMTAELDRLLLMYGPARSMPFSKLMYALQIDANDGRRARNAHGVAATPFDQAPMPGAGAATVQLQSEQQRFHQSTSSRQEKMEKRSDLANPSSLRQVICDFVDGHIPAVTFRMQLQRFGVALTQDLDKMIRTHEGDSSVRFQDFARVLLRQDKTSAPSGSVTPSGYRSVTPRSDAMFARSGGSSVRSSLPFASGGQWDDQLPEPQPSQRPSVVPVVPVAPPYATQEDASELRRPPAASTSRAQGHHGDILGWNQAPLREEQKGPTGRRHVTASSGQSFLQWAESQDEEQRPGRRLYGQAASASESAPYGRSSDVSQHVCDPRMPAAPFGTDQDLRLRRPEDAGTDEYRAALGGVRR